MPIKKRRDNYDYKGKLPRKTYLMPTYNKKDCFKFYCTKYNLKKNQNNKLAVSYNLYSKIIDSYNLSLCELIKTGVKVKLPYSLGDFQVLKIKKPVEKYELAAKSFADLYVLIPVIKWYKRFIRIINKNFYSFTPARTLKNSVKDKFYNTNFSKQVLDL